MQTRAVHALLLVCFLLVFVFACGGAKPYKLMAEAARSPERPAVFVHDKRLRLHLREALVVASPGSTLSISPYVVGGHAYLVGWVDTDGERADLEAAAQGVSGLLSVAVYMPVKPTGADAPSSTAELELKAKVTASLLAANRSDKINIAVEVLGTHAVLIGALGSAEDVRRADEAASETSGISGVTSFLSVPPESDEKRLGGFLR